MKNTYHISGMSCEHCRQQVEQALNSLAGVTGIVTLAPPRAELITDNDISLPLLQQVLSTAGNYIITPDDHTPPVTTTIKNAAKPTMRPVSGNYYCPMHCEEDKTYNKPGNCPVCGMNLVKAPEPKPAGPGYTCPMHPEIIRKEPGVCPICGMDLIPIASSGHEDDQLYHKLLLRLKIAIGFTVPVFLISMTGMMKNNLFMQVMDTEKWDWLQLILTIPVIYTCRSFFTRAAQSVRTWNLNMFTLVGLGTGIAFLFSLFGLFFPQLFPAEFKTDHGNVALYFEATTVILTLVLLGEVLEARAHSQTGNAIKALLKLAPTEATLVVNGEERTIAIDNIQKGDLIRVKPGGKIPVDGKITALDGLVSIDESMITGEPIPMDKKLGDPVIAGTINSNRSFVMCTEKVGAETLLAQIVQLVSDASRSKAPIQKLTDRIAQYFVPVVILIALITFGVWVIFGPEPKLVFGLINAISVMIIACPCALGLATPMSIMVGIGQGARFGILIRNAEALEKMDKVDVLIADKTGTLTEGKPSVEQIYAIRDNHDEIIRLIASLNQYSEHPLARAMVVYAVSKHLSLESVNDFNAITGKGVTGTVAQTKVALGNPALLQEAGIFIPPDLIQKVTAAQQQGKTVSYIAISGAVAGYVVIGDAMKRSSYNAISALKKQGIQVMMLTGDNENTASAVAAELRLTDFKAGCLPQDKLNEIKKLQAEGKIVAMAGDGINDAPALAQANIGIAMGTGTDVAIESAEITLIKGDLQDIVKAKSLSHAVMRNIRQNLFFAFVYNALGIPIAAGLFYPLFGLLLSPMIAALAMSFSSVSVILNALRLRNTKM